MGLATITSPLPLPSSPPVHRRQVPSSPCELLFGGPQFLFLLFLGNIKNLDSRSLTSFLISSPLDADVASTCCFFPSPLNISFLIFSCPSSPLPFVTCTPRGVLCWKHWKLRAPTIFLLFPQQGKEHSIFSSLHLIFRLSRASQQQLL